MVAVLKSQAKVVEQSYQLQIEANSRVSTESTTVIAAPTSSTMRLVSQLQTKSQRLRASFAEICENANRQIANQLQNLEKSAKALLTNYSNGGTELGRNSSRHRLLNLQESTIPTLESCILQNGNGLNEFLNSGPLQINRSLWASVMGDRDIGLPSTDKTQKDNILSRSSSKGRGSVYQKAARETQLERQSQSWKSNLGLLSPRNGLWTDRVTVGAPNLANNDKRPDQHTIRALGLMGRTNDLLKRNTHKDAPEFQQALNMIGKQIGRPTGTFMSDLRASATELRGTASLSASEARLKKSLNHISAGQNEKRQTKSFIKQLLGSQQPPTNRGVGLSSQPEARTGPKTLDSLLAKAWPSSGQITPKA